MLVRVRVWGWVRVMVEFGTSSAFRGWVRVKVLGYGFGVRGRKVKSRDCALASDLVRAVDGRLSTYKAAQRLTQKLNCSRNQLSCRITPSETFCCWLGFADDIRLGEIKRNT